MRNRWIALVALPLLAAGCARGGEGDEGAALNDTANSATLTGDTTTAVTPPAGMPMDSTSAAGMQMDSAQHAQMMDSTMHSDSAAHP
jgi:hypothetical protein